MPSPSPLFRITSTLLNEVHCDLSRPHPFALERVTFLLCRGAGLVNGRRLLLAHSVHRVDDDDYEQSLTVGAMLNGNAFRKMLQQAYRHDVSVFHLHRHDHNGKPTFSSVDLRESAKFVPDFFKVRPMRPHGAILLSHDSIYGLVWEQIKARPRPISEFQVIGPALKGVSYDVAE